MGIPETIIQQLGGSARLKAFIGAYHIFKDSENAVVFKFKGSRKANYVKITLNSMDLYDLEFMTLVTLTPDRALKWIGLSPEELDAKIKKNLKSYNGVYCDQLVDIFESHTGLFLHL